MFSFCWLLDLQAVSFFCPWCWGSSSDVKYPAKGETLQMGKSEAKLYFRRVTLDVGVQSEKVYKKLILITFKM